MAKKYTIPADRPSSLMDALRAAPPRAGDTVILQNGGVYDLPRGGLALWDQATIATANPNGPRAVLRANNDNGLVVLRPIGGLDLDNLQVTDQSGDPGSPAFNSTRQGPDKGSIAGLSIGAPVSQLLATNCLFEFFESGVDFEFIKGGSSQDIDFEDCRFARNWAIGAQQFQGQGVFAAAVRNLTFRRCRFDSNGRVDGVSWKPQAYRHGLYASFGDPTEGVQPVRGLLIEDSSAINNSNFGWQIRIPEAIIRRSVAVGNSVGLMVNGPGSPLIEDYACVANGCYEEQNPTKGWVTVGGAALHCHAATPSLRRITAVQPGFACNYPMAAISAGPRDGDQGWEYKGSVSPDASGVMTAGFATPMEWSGKKGTLIVGIGKLATDASARAAQLVLDLRSRKVEGMTAVNAIKAMVA